MRISDWSSDVCSSDLFHQRCATNGVVVGVQRTDELVFVAADRTAAAGEEATGSGQGFGLLADDGADLGPAGPHEALSLDDRMVSQHAGGGGEKEQALAPATRKIETAWGR